MLDTQGVGEQARIDAISLSSHLGHEGLRITGQDNKVAASGITSVFLDMTGDTLEGSLSGFLTAHKYVGIIGVSYEVQSPAFRFFIRTLQDDVTR